MRDVQSHGVRRIESLSMRREAGRWTYADNHREVIDEHWVRAVKAYPGFFNGTIHVLSRFSLEGTHAQATCLATQFKNFLYWRDEGFPEEARVRDGFGSALIRSCDGHIVLGRQRAGNINEGLAYLPGGFIDERDVASDGTVDIRASVAREVFEETGLGGEALQAEPHLLLTMAYPHVSFAVPYLSPLNGAELADRIRAHIACDANSELADCVIVRAQSDLDGLAMAHYARVLLLSALAWER